MMKITWEKIVIILLSILLICTILGGIFWNEDVRGKYQLKIDAKNDSIRKKENEIFELKLNEKALFKKLDLRLKEIESQKKYIKYLKKVNNEKVDSVFNLNNDSSLVYITNWLSQRDSLRGR